MQSWLFSWACDERKYKPDSSESIATLPPFGPIEGLKWFDQISSQWESQKNRFAFISFGKNQFLPPCIWNLPFMSTASEYWMHAAWALRPKKQNIEVIPIICFVLKSAFKKLCRNCSHFSWMVKQFVIKSVSYFFTVPRKTWGCTSCNFLANRRNSVLYLWSTCFLALLKKAVNL